MRQFADNPKVDADAGVRRAHRRRQDAVGASLSDAAKNLLRTVIDNGRLAALPEIAAQFQALVERAHRRLRRRRSTARSRSTPAQLAEVKAALERRFGRKLERSVVVEPELIGGIRVVVGDEVLDTSVNARLEQMKAALTPPERAVARRRTTSEFQPACRTADRRPPCN